MSSPVISPLISSASKHRNGLGPLPWFGALLAMLLACGGGQPPRLEDIADQEISVGEELVIVLIGSDPEGDDLEYSFVAPIQGIEQRAQISLRPDGAGLFRWRPAAGDEGVWYFDFMVTDRSGSDVDTVKIEVKPEIGAQTEPIFRQPLGTGNILDLRTEECLELDIVVDDPDTPQVDIGQEPPLIDGAMLTRLSDQTARWRWCPTPEQIKASERYTLILSADDRSNPKVIKEYNLILLLGSGVCEACSTDAECGASGDLCVKLDTSASASNCLTACAGPDECPTGFTCSVNPLESIEGTALRQCVPDTGSCEGLLCQDDALEENDTRIQADAIAPLESGVVYDSLIMCPVKPGFAEEEDWYRLEVAATGTIDIELIGADEPDMDLFLFDSTDTELAQSTGFFSEEQISECVAAGTYYARVIVAIGTATGEDPYQLTYTFTPNDCTPALAGSR